jgi:riboflavin synthase
MFTGLIEETGSVAGTRATTRMIELQITAPVIAAESKIGDSVSVNGCCLTITTVREEAVAFDLLQETLDRTNLHTLRRDSRVNLERALAANGRLGGHFVQGHIDCALPVLSYESRGADMRLEVELPDEFARYVASKGSVALNGISLTIAEVLPASFVVWIIPHTRQQTNLDQLVARDLLNVEFDILAKYVDRMLSRGTATEA